mgnify:CR=1 FL=1
MVTIKEITDDRFYNKIENLKKEIDSNFKKNKNKNKCIILLNIILDIILFLVMPIFSYFVLSKITALFLAILFSLLIFIFSDLVIYFTRNFIEKNSKDYKYNKKLKRKIAFYNIKKYKENKGKKLIPLHIKINLLFLFLLNNSGLNHWCFCRLSHSFCYYWNCLCYYWSFDWFCTWNNCLRHNCCDF